MQVNATERKGLRRAKTLLVAGDRTGALAILRELDGPPNRARLAEGGQLLFAFVTFRCERLATDGIAAHVCVTRQKVTDLQRTQQSSRGQGTDYPLCDSRSCAQGRTMRERLDPRTVSAWQGAGPGGRFERERSREDAGPQEAARERLRRTGLLGAVPTVDGVPARDEEA